MKIGIAGTPPPATWTNWDVFYQWRIGDLGRKKTAPLHKLKRQQPGALHDDGLHASWDAVGYIVDEMVNDTVGKRMGHRVLQLLNERSKKESDWADAPREAATWVARVILSVRAVCPWVQFAGPNLWPSQEAEVWLWEFFDELERRRAPLDIYAVHGYPLLWDEAGFLRHLDHVADNARPLALVSGYPVWITEIGDLWGSSLPQVRKWMRQTERFLGEHADSYDITACMWFVSRDSYWHGLSPNTEIYDENWKLTPQGGTWWGVWKRLSRGGE